jgi:histidine triad (HIT) family protein
MSLHGTYDDTNLFAKILRGEVPAVKVLEDDEVVAFMDIFPQARGHMLVVPKNVKARNFLELPAERVAPLMERVHRLTIATEKVLKPDGITVTQFNGAPAGQTIFHLHFHIIPVTRAFASPATATRTAPTSPSLKPSPRTSRRRCDPPIYAS